MANIPKSNFWIVLAFIAMFARSVYGQILGDDGTRSITTDRFHSFMRQPGGLQKITDVIGDFSFDDIDERWGEFDLPSLKRTSPLVVTAAIENTGGVLSADGDDVETVYSLRILNTLKGDAIGQISVKSDGGKVKFPNGHSVTFHTPAWDKLKVGDKYVLFLTKRGDDYWLVAGARGVLHVSDETQIVHLLDRDPAHDAGLHDLDGVPLSIVEQKVRDAKE